MHAVLEQAPIDSVVFASCWDDFALGQIQFQIDVGSGVPELSKSRSHCVLFASEDAVIEVRKDELQAPCGPLLGEPP